MSYMPPMKERILHYFRDLYYNNRKDYEHLSSGLDAFEKEIRFSGWIPCSEKMPEISQNVLWTVNKEKHPDAPFDIIIGAYHLNLDYDIWKDWCTAWMPLPEPYKLEKGE